MVRLFDNTLRDGGNVVGHGFPISLTQSIIGALLEAGIPDIECGNCKGLGAYAKADKLDDALLERLPIAFDERLGFLTAVPTNLGTGMQAMLDLHLPALAGQGLIDQLTVMIGKLGLSLQPLYDGHGSFYRLTNQVTLGITEKAAIDNVNAICDQIVRQERNLRQQLQQQDAFLDRIYRAMGTLQMARTLNQDEFFDLVSLLRLGISLGESSKTYSDVGELIQKVQNATIAAAAGAEVLGLETSYYS